MKVKKVLTLLLAVVMVTGTVLTGCGNDSDNSGSGGNSGTQTDGSGGNSGSGDEGGSGNSGADATPFYKTLDPNITAELDVMCWSGDSTYHEDVGHQNWAAEDISTQNVAIVYAVAKAFNEMYPNVKINLYAKADDPNGNDTPWQQELENFRAEHGKYPDVYTPNDTVGDVTRGMVADLSVYADDPLYQSFNESLMGLMNYHGMQAGIPQFMQPWGVYVNRELAETNNIDVPGPDWDIDEYTDFITSANNSTVYGTIDNLTQFIGTGTNTIIAQMAAYNGSGDHVNLTSDEVTSLLDYIPQWAESEVWTLNGMGAIDSAIMDAGGWWGYTFFTNNLVLAYAGDPWMMNVASLSQNDDGSWPWGAVQSYDWDIYPRPATDYRGNTVGVVIDPMAVHNFAMDDGDPAWSDEEKTNLDLAYAFSSFWCGATEAFEARVNQMYYNNGTLTTCLNDSLPLVTGDAFYEQMNLWYSTESHARYGNKDLMPGFQEVLRLWEAGEMWDVSDKTYPYYVTVDGVQTVCLYEWSNCTNAEVTGGVGVTDPGWVDTVKANLADWNSKINARFDEAESLMREGLKTYYGFTDADF